MLSLWIVLVSMMADVIGRGHGGDGAEEPPPPGGDDFWRGHGADVPRKKTRGKAKNLQLRDLVDEGGRPLDLTFDEEATNMPIGTNGGLFTRELGLYIWRHIPLDREGFRNVPAHYRNALFVHLNENFNLTAVEKDDLASQKKGGINCKIQKTYNNRKSKAKAEFLRRGGYNDVERARASVPDDMSNANWQKAVDHFMTIEHRNKSAINAAARAKQLHTYRGGTTSYASACFKQNLERYDGYRAGHTDREGRFDSPQNEENYRKLVAEFESENQRRNEEGCSSQQVNKISIFEKVFGKRRGHTRGLGPNPCPREGSLIPTRPTEKTPPSEFTQEQIASLLENPQFRNEMMRMIIQGSATSDLGNQNHEEDQENDNTDDDDDYA